MLLSPCGVAPSASRPLSPLGRFARVPEFPPAPGHPDPAPPGPSAPASGSFSSLSPSPKLPLPRQASSSRARPPCCARRCRPCPGPRRPPRRPPLGGRWAARRQAGPPSGSRRGDSCRAGAGRGTGGRGWAAGCWGGSPGSLRNCPKFYLSWVGRDQVAHGQPLRNCFLEDT